MKRAARRFALAALAIAVLGGCGKDEAPAPVAGAAPVAAKPAADADVEADEAPANASNEPRPLLWQVSDGDNTVYLLGSFHMLRASDWPLPPAVDAAFDDAEHVAFELSPADLVSPELPMLLMTAATLPAGQDLESMLEPETWSQLQAYAAKRQLPLVAFERTEPWFVALLISLTEMERAGLDPEQGMDRRLAARAVDEGKRTSGLETIAEQVDALDSMTPEEQMQSLRESLEESERFVAEVDELHALWRRGDEAGLYERMGRELRDEYPELYQRIDVDRNLAWLPKVRAMLDDEHEDDALVVVGSLHLIGDDGLVALLRGQGLTVERVERD